jgi:GntR family transcriptional regulator/MocR family aminotransferase
LETQKIKPKLIHVTPSCQYPTGIQMTQARREELLQFASQNKSIIIENDYEHELNNSSHPLPAIFSLDKEQRTIYLGTFNRILHPSIRIGYMVVPKQLIKPIEIMLKHSHRFVAPSIQYVLNQFIEKRYLQNHFVNLIETVSAREDFFRQTFKSVFNANELEIMPQKVLGLQSLIKINSSSLDEQTIIACLAQNQISVHSLQACSLTKTKNKGLLMGHSSVSKTIIKNKLTRMRQLILEASEKNA